jgi:hypothetical protein
MGPKREATESLPFGEQLRPERGCARATAPVEGLRTHQCGVTRREVLKGAGTTAALISLGTLPAPRESRASGQAKTEDGCRAPK